MNFYFRITTILLTVTMLISSCGSSYSELPVVPKVALDKYLGLWYDIASFPQRFQEGCSCSTAEYSLKKNGDIRVKNSCKRDGEIDIAEGTAWVKDEATNAKLKVRFFWPFSGDYWIIDLAEDYSYAVVGEEKREYLWILSRQPQMDETTYQGILTRLTELEFDVNKLNQIDQSCHSKP